MKSIGEVGFDLRDAKTRVDRVIMSERISLFDV